MLTERSSDYRRNWFSENKDKEDSRGRYRCVYCGRKFKKQDITIDHVIPVFAAKRSFLARMYLHSNGIHNVNDTANLVPACAKCNKKKGASIRGYPIKASLGKHEMWWLIVRLFRLAVVITIAYLLWRYRYQILALAESAKRSFTILKQMF